MLQVFRHEFISSSRLAVIIDLAQTNSCDKDFTRVNIIIEGAQFTRITLAISVFCFFHAFASACSLKAFVVKSCRSWASIATALLFGTLLLMEPLSRLTFVCGIAFTSQGLGRVCYSRSFNLGSLSSPETRSPSWKRPAGKENVIIIQTLSKDNKWLSVLVRPALCLSAALAIKQTDRKTPW